MEERLDRISSLPVEILRRISSLLPLEEAVRTSTLSSVWKSLWTPVQVDMEFDTHLKTRHEASKEVIEVISPVLRSYASPEVWKFCLTFPESDKEPSLEAKDEVIVLATKGTERELHLEFSKRQKRTGHLKLEQTCKGFSNHHDMQMAGFSTLKTLHLRSVPFLARDLVSALFSNCKLLESLKLDKCTGLESLDIEAGDCLRSLIVVNCADILHIKISARKLVSFWYQGSLPQIKLTNTPNLVDVMLNLKDGVGHYEFDCEEVLSLFASLKEVEILTISGWLLEWLCSAGVIFKRLEFQFNKLKELRWIDSLINRPKRDSLASFINIAPSLEKLFVRVDRSQSSVPCPCFHQYWHEPHLWMDFTAVKSSTTQLKHLKIVGFLGFRVEDDQLLLMELLLNKAIVLSSMNVISPSKRSWRVVKVPLSQLKPASSWNHQKHIAVLSPNKEFFFVFTEEIYGHQGGFESSFPPSFFPGC